VAKLILKLEELAVESFTVDRAHGAGTVRAHDETFESECRCDTDSCQCGSVESCTVCGCDTPGYTCEARCYPQPITDAVQAVQAVR